MFRWVNYGEEFDSQVLLVTIMVMVQLTLGYLIIQMIFTALGFNFLGAEIERSSNKLVLNNLEEGVIILEQKDKSVLFANEAAEKFHESIHCQSLIVNQENKRFILKQELFAPIDYSIFDD